LLAGSAVAGGPTPAGLVREGNEAFEVGSFDEALKLYRKAAKERPGSAEIAFDQGTALYRKKDFAGAAQRFTEAAQRAGDPALGAKAEYNLGNTHFRQAEQAKEGGDLKESIKATRQSVGHYREALRLDSRRREAGENLEMARGYLKTLLEEQKQQPQNQQQQQQDGENKEDQQQQQSQSQQGQGQEKQGEQSKEQEGQNQPQEGKDQAGKQQQQEGKDKEQQQAGQQQEEEKKDAEQSGSEQKDKDEADKQQQAAQGKEGPKDEKGQDDKQAEKIDEAARAILDEEKENQERRMKLPVRGMKPVDKDW
jgi:Ca-activated chloride channel homolog